MQTFLPYPSFLKSLDCLDYRRLGKQRVEALQLINAIEGRSKGWVNHPCTLMWKNNLAALKIYHNTAIILWIERGYNNTMKLMEVGSSNVELPSWFGNRDFHRSHQSNLLRKDKEYYSKFFEGVPDDLPYIWPEPVKI